jgi:hypothetical protein
MGRTMVVDMALTCVGVWVLLGPGIGAEARSGTISPRPTAIVRVTSPARLAEAPGMSQGHGT